MTNRHPISFFVPGIAKPAGSKRAFYVAKLKRAVITDDCAKSKDWKGDVKHAAKAAMHDAPPLKGPVSLVVEFRMQRPKSHYGTGRNASLLKPGAAEWHTSKPDATKLLRCIEDAMTGIVWDDDAQVVRQEVIKRYDEKPGAMVVVRSEE